MSSCRLGTGILSGYCENQCPDITGTTVRKLQDACTKSTRIIKRNRVLVEKKYSRIFEDNKERFLQEARVLAMFSKNDAVVAVKEHFEENGTAYIVMEYLDGQTLKQTIKQRKMAYSEAVSMMQPIGKALTKIHQFNVIHKDVSPENIMVLNDNNVKLLDFGGAINFIESDQEHIVSFKNGYAPPEQYQMSGKLGAWTDVYSFAATIYYCLTGFKPPAVKERQAGALIKKPSELGVKIPATAEAALLRALSLKPESRYSRIEDFWNEFSVLSAKGRGNKILFGLLAIIAIVIVIAIVFLLPKKTTDSEETKVALTEDSVNSANLSLPESEEELMRIGDEIDIGEGTYLFINLSNPNYCLGIESGFGDDYAKLVLRGGDDGFTESNSSRLSVEQTDNKDCDYLRINHTNSYIQAEDYLSEGSAVFQNSEYVDGAASEWRFFYGGYNESSDEEIVIIKNSEGLALTPLENNCFNGNSVVLEKENLDNDAQKWIVRWSQHDENEPMVTVYKEGDMVSDLEGTKNFLSAFGDNGEIMISVSGDDSQEEKEMIVWENVWDVTQQFELEYTGVESRYRIIPKKQKKSLNKCLEYDEESGKLLMQEKSDSPDQLFRIIYSSYNMYLIQTYNESVVGFDLGEDGQFNGQALYAKPYDKWEDSRFIKWLLINPQ